ncbi:MULTISPECIES: hypothetical protein [Paraburkholderia]|uniref:Uncharacterized protein n=1 Tax=Paraburkholderia youngii TaxID=2782701 RepID=A0ABX2NYV7_9BURK|nr:hypothetical protein [Paraburkholderia youngii]NVI09712.1 hypothetical protein [Paraburkholderia youngii]
MSAIKHKTLLENLPASQLTERRSGEAVCALIVASMTPAADDLAGEIRRELEARHAEADRLRLRAIERARVDADLAQRCFMLVHPSN